MEGCESVSVYKGLLITKNQELLNDHIQQLISEESIDITVIAEWKRTFHEQQFFHYIFVDIDTIDFPHQQPASSGSILIALTENHEFDLARSWLVAGAKDVIVLPKEASRFKQLISKTREQYQFQKETEHGIGTGEVHAFYSAKGGSGKTLLSAIAAQSLSIHHESKVILIDLNAQFGNIDVIFGVQPFRSYYDLIPVIGEMDIRHIQNVSTIHQETKVTLLTGPANPAKSENLPDELIGKMIRVARNHFDYVILDLPSAMNNMTFTGLNDATHIHYIITPDSLGMRAYQYTEDLFERFQIGRGKDLSLIINRYHAKSELTKKDIEKIVHKESKGKFSADYFAIQPFINMGQSFYKKKKDKGNTKVSKEMKKYIDELKKG